MTEPENPPAFPFQANNGDGGHFAPDYGMTLRDWFAGQAVIGLLAGQYRDTSLFNFDALPKEAFDVADAMLAERAK